MNDTKKCNCCKNIYNVDHFRNNGKECIECRAIRNESKKKWRAQRKEQGLPLDNTSKEKMAEWREKNADHIKKYSLDYYKDNTLVIKVKKKKYRTENRDSLRESYNRWRRDNPERCTELSARRRARKRNATPKWLTEEDFKVMRTFYAESHRLTKETGIDHAVDHIHPLAGEDFCGLHVPWNLQVLTRSENSTKKNYLLNLP